MMYIGRKQKILVAVLAFTLFLTIGYALFSENITINGTAQAKGTFSLSSTCTMGFSQDIVDYMGVSQDEMQSGYADESCVPSGNTVTMQTSLLYPGALRYFTVTITNNGTIDAVLPLAEGGQEYKISQTVKVYNISNDTLLNTYSSSQSDFYAKTANFSRFIGFGDGSLVLAKNSNGVSVDANELGMMTVDGNGVSYFRLKPGESALVVISVEWKSSATDKTKYSVATGTLTLPFTQATTDLQDTTEGFFCFNGC